MDVRDSDGSGGTEGEFMLGGAQDFVLMHVMNRRLANIMRSSNNVDR